MQKKLILLLIFTVLVTVFALQNSMEAELSLWFWSVRTSMALILILTFAVGAIAGILFSLPGWSKSSKKPDPETSETPVEVTPSDETAAEKSQEANKSPGKDPEFEDVSN